VEFISIRRQGSRGFCVCFYLDDFLLISLGKGAFDGMLRFSTRECIKVPKALGFYPFARFVSLSTLHFVICYICQNGFMLPLSRVSLLFVPRAHSQLCGIWHLHFYGNTFRGLGRNYFPISSPVNRKFYCSCIRSRVCGPLSSIFFPRVQRNEDEEASTVIWQIYCSHNIAYNTSISGPATPTHTVRPQPTIYT